MKYSAGLALLAAGAAQAQSGFARFGLKGGKFDVNGFAANGLDVFGFDKNGKDAWGRPIHDQAAGLVAPVGKVLPPKYNPTTTAATTTTKAHTKAKPVQTPTPTPFHTPTYTTLFQGGTSVVVPVVESTVVWPMDTVTRTVIETHSINIQPTPPVFPRPEESQRTSCYNGLVTIETAGSCNGPHENFQAEMIFTEIAYLSGTKTSDWDVVSVSANPKTGGSTITAVTCSDWAFHTLEADVTKYPTNYEKVTYAPTSIKFCEEGGAGPCLVLPVVCPAPEIFIAAGGKCVILARRSVRDAAECSAQEYFVGNTCRECALVPGCTEVTCTEKGDATCTKCHAALSVSSIGACA